MLFNSFQFLLFFFVVTCLYYTVNSKWQWLLLLIASCYFYASFIFVYLLVLFAVIIIDFFAGKAIERAVGSQRSLFLAVSIIANLSILVVFKYYNFFIGNINQLLGSIDATAKPFQFWQIVLPLGLSFHTFQAMSYTIEVYRRNQKAEEHFGIYALYVMFYPQLVAGPIERPQRMLHQFHERHRLDYDNVANGLKIMLWGFFMKVVVADRLAIYVDYVYADVSSHGRLALITAIIFYSFQIYCDFAGYSLIAIGSAKVLGFQLSTNFNHPYLASSLSNFWERWHISLSTWFRDYVYIPLGGNKGSVAKYAFNILMVFFLSGLWHGASWNFVIWGILHGICLLIERIFRKNRKGLSLINRLLGSFYTIVIAAVLFVFFRAATTYDALMVFRNTFSDKIPWVKPGDFNERALIVYSVAGILCVMLADIQGEFFPKVRILSKSKHAPVRMAAYVLLILVILLLGVFDGSQFIYFQF